MSKTPLPIYLLWCTPAMLRGDSTLESVTGLLGVVLVRPPRGLRARLLLRRRPGPPDTTSGTWVDSYGLPLSDPFDSAAC